MGYVAAVVLVKTLGWEWLPVNLKRRGFATEKKMIKLRGLYQDGVTETVLNQSMVALLSADNAGAGVGAAAASATSAAAAASAASAASAAAAAAAAAVAAGGTDYRQAALIQRSVLRLFLATIKYLLIQTLGRI